MCKINVHSSRSSSSSEDQQFEIYDKLDTNLSDKINITYDLSYSYLANEALDDDFYDPSLLSYLGNLMHTIPGEEYLKAAYHPVTINVGAGIETDNVLFDTGALHANYISSSFVDKHYQHLRKHMFRKSSTTTLADKKTKIPLEYVAFIPLTVTSKHDEVISAVLPFWVFEMGGNDMIIGLPSILKYFKMLLIDMLLDANIQSDKHELSQVNDTGLLDPWSHIREAAPEEEDDVVPSSFPTFIANMNITMENAMQDYLAKLPEQVTPEFVKGTSKPVMQLLRTKGSRVFIPDLENWAGIQGIEPLVIEVTDDCPEVLKPKVQHINKKLFDPAAQEIERLTKYMYVPSDSPIASNIVVAPKATHPFIRICGNYPKINQYIKLVHHPVKKVQNEIGRIAKFKYFVNADLTNSFHQIPLDPRSRGILSIVTPFGQYEPKFLPEGVSLASHILQKWMDIIFKDCEDWLIVIWDNLLVMADTYDELYDRLEQFLDICIKHNLRLKLTKTWFGQEEVDFFGYQCGHLKYGLSETRKKAIADIPMPSSATQMRSFLGSANFFSSFLPNYSTLTAPLHDMVRKEFNWTDKSGWNRPYEEFFNAFKLELIKAVEIFYPDFDLPWIMRTDASTTAVGASLFMIFTHPDGREEYRPIGFMSHKFSDVARKWSTIEQECFACYFGIKHFSYLLRGKPFTLETDHRNLIWMERSEVAKIIRWVIYMQGFDFKIKHIPGKSNTVADYLSRCHATLPQTESHSLQSMLCSINLLSVLFNLPDGEEGDGVASHNDANITSVLNNLVLDPVDEVLHGVHNARTGHWGVTKTMQKLDTEYPGHKIPYKVVADYIAKCAICQKERLNMANSLKPIVRHLKPAYQRATIGIDDLTITPADQFGNTHLIVIVVHFTKLAWGHPCKECDADAVCAAMLIFFSLYGSFDTVMSDPGSAIMAKAVELLNKYLGFKNQKVSLVDRHTSNGVEGTNKQILRHIRALTMEERIADKWSSPIVLPLIFFIINSSWNSETNMIPYHAHFGTAEATYFKMPETLTEEEQTHEYVKLLDENLRILSAASKRYQDQLVAERTKDTPIETQNIYQPGDLVLWEAYQAHDMRATKLTPKYKGPYEVIKHVKNDVTARHVNLGFVTELDSLRLKRFIGSHDEAVRIAMVDQNQFLIDSILSYKGHESKRTTMQFLVQFADGTKVWKYYDKDLADSQQFEDFCRRNRQLLPLLMTTKIASKYLRDLNKKPIDLVVPGDIVYVDIRSWGSDNEGVWYDQLPMPDKYEKQYVVKGIYGQYVNNRRLRIYVTFPVFNETHQVNNEFVTHYGYIKTKRSEATEISNALLQRYPELTK